MYRLGFIISLLSITLTSCIPEDNTPVEIPLVTGRVLEIDMGGASEPYQVWLDLSTGELSKNIRTDYDLAFYSGTEWKVALNASVMMAAGSVGVSKDIKSIGQKDVESLMANVAVGTFTDNSQYIDDPTGMISFQKSGIGDISPIDDLNPVFLVNMGYIIYTDEMNPGSVYTAGTHRGWMKIRMLRRQEGYLLQYAPLNSTEIKETIIPKSNTHHFTYFSLKNHKQIQIRPEKKKWDVGFTVLTNLTPFPGTGYSTSYIFSDMVITNVLSGVAAYRVDTPAGKAEEKFKAFTADQIEPSRFNDKDQRAIGADWRTTTGPNGAEVFNDRFFIVRDTDGHVFKLLFTKMKDSKGYRGFPGLQYQPL